jgi:hypothetical protein
LSSKPILWIGERSYAIYLWHWIIFQVTRPSVDLAGATWALYALRILIVFALADISLRWIELPVRNGTIESWFRGMKYRTKRVRVRQKTSVIAGVLILTIATSLVSASAITRSARESARLKATLVQQELPSTQTPTPAISNIPGLWVTGDSVILGIRFALDQKVRISLINARVGRQAGELITVIKHDKSTMAGSPIILDLGNNNRLTTTEVDTIFSLLADQPKIIIVNTAVPRPWREWNDELIGTSAAKYPQTVVVDWNSLSHGHPEYFGPDGVHLVQAGIDVYVAAILEALNTNK